MVTHTATLDQCMWSRESRLWEKQLNRFQQLHQILSYTHHMYRLERAETIHNNTQIELESRLVYTRAWVFCGLIFSLVWSLCRAGAWVFFCVGEELISSKVLYLVIVERSKGSSGCRTIRPNHCISVCSYFLSSMILKSSVWIVINCLTSIYRIATL